MGEKFAANPVTGTGSMSVPIATSPGRSGFGPRLSLAYDSGSGNGSFGFGWNLSLPAITRKTDKGLPKYRDAEESDVFVLSGAEDLVPILVQNPHGQWERERLPARTVGGITYQVTRYRPRVEGLFARIERWENTFDVTDVFWRSISKDNITSWYGRTPESRLSDPVNASHIFSWLICQSHDDKGNVIVYGYSEEDSVRIFEDKLGNAVVKAHERNRTTGSRSAQRYLKRIRYGNRPPYFPVLEDDAPWPEPQDAVAPDGSNSWLFEIVLDYGEHDVDVPTSSDIREWPTRNDPFSSYRAGFEIRTYRTCRRVLMFHHFPGQIDVGRDCLVRSTDFTYSDDVDTTAVANPAYTFLRSVAQTVYRRANGGYDSRSLPPVEFEYTEPIVQSSVEQVDASSLDNLPVGLDGTSYRWTDLHGEGIPGILTEQAGAWHYMRNLSAIPDKRSEGRELVKAKFAPLETVALKPTVALSGGAELVDLAGDGQPDVVVMQDPMPGFYEHDGADGWQPFRSFTSRLNFDIRDPNVSLVDLDGDGHADVLITEDDALVWHASLAEEGFGPAQRVAQALDEEEGPHVAFTDGRRSIYLADLSGDGLTDIVRIRNGEVCYWPNLGSGRFGPKVTMDNAPWFDNPDQFDQQRIRLADIDGSGTTDIIYLHRDGVRLYFNQSGNGWSKPQELAVFPRVDQVVSILPIDLLGTGTACLVWSSPLAGDAGRQMRYVDLMGGTKPHLLVKTVNNLGAETRIDYAPSTKFYLLDKRDGNAWITRLPFPVHVVEKVTTYDHISRNRFVTRYAYHHGYFDGEEREFRGFGMVEQWDTEDSAALTDGNIPADNIAPESNIPPVHTKTWFHTGLYSGRDHISNYFASLRNAADNGEYFREPGLTDVEARALLLPDTIIPGDLTVGEEQEACRALRGSMLRQEVYADDAGQGATPQQVQRARAPYTVTEQNFTVRTMQPRGGNRHAVFFPHAGEAIVYQYERNPADPRIQHALTLEVDAFGNVLKQAAVGYGRRRQIRAVDDQGDALQAPNPGLTALHATDQAKQTTPLLTYTKNRVTNAIETSDTYRTPLPCEALTYELTGYTPTGMAGRFQASDLVKADCAAARRMPHEVTDEVPYEAEPTGSPCRRPIELLRTLYRRDDLTGLLPLGELQSLALPGESYRLAFTPGLLTQAFQRPRAGQPAEALLPDPGTVLGGQAGDRGGYLRTQAMKTEGLFPATDADDSWWIPSGQSFFTNNPLDASATELVQARQHFFLPRRYRDPFRQDAFVDFDAEDLLITETRDALGNRVTVDVNDYRVLQPRLVSDPNHNQTEVAFDTLGMVVGIAVMGKPPPAPVEGDTLAGLAADLTQAQLDGFFGAADPRATAAALLKGATTRIVYDLDRFHRTRQANPNAPIKWRPACAATLGRETHVNSPLPPHGLRIKVSLSYSDGFGREIQKKIQAEPGPVEINDAQAPAVNPRWVCSGWTIFNNKGKPVRQYEPFFSATHDYEFRVLAGVSPVLFYDPAGRVIATLHPNHTYEKVVFDSWHQTTYDVNDTCAARGLQTGDPRTDPDIGGYVTEYFKASIGDAAEPWRTWLAQRIGGARGADEQDAAQRAAAHADTPTAAHFDTLGRPFLTVARNRVVCPGHDLDGTDDNFATRVDLDIQGNQRVVRDAIQQAGDSLGRIVMRCTYDMLGNRICQFGMDAGARWRLNDVAGKPVRVWDSRGHNFTTTYDALRRPVEQTVRGTTSESSPQTQNRDILVDKIDYGESVAHAATLNLRTRIYRHLDSAGVATNASLGADDSPTEAFDFKGNLLRSTRQLVSDYTAIPDWLLGPELENEKFEGVTRYDALNRPIQSIAPRSDLSPAKRNVIQPMFNEASLLERVDVWLEYAEEPGALLDPNTEQTSPVGVANIDYNAKGQRLRIDYKNGSSTLYDYDKLTFRLMHLYTRRGEVFTDDCGNPNPPPPTIAAPDTPSKGKSCGLQNLRYTYDPAGNITRIRDDAQQAIFFHNRIVEPSSDYTYDATYRLVRSTGREHLGQAGGIPVPHSSHDALRMGLPHPGDGNALGSYTETYNYDSVGNLLQLQHQGTDPAHPGWTRKYAYSEPSLLEPDRHNNQLSRTAPGTRNSPESGYRYDAHGNATRLAHLGGSNPHPNLHWNHDDRLQQADLGSSGTTYYLYNAVGQRVRKVWEKAAGLTEERLYFGDLEVYRRHSGGEITLERQALHIRDDSKRIALVEMRTRDTLGADPAPPQLARYQIGNHLASSSIELDEQSRVISYEEYTPYGSTAYQAARRHIETPKRFRYTAKERDDETGLSYHGARYYAPWLTRWVSCDPVYAEGMRASRAPDALFTGIARDARENPTQPGRRPELNLLVNLYSFVYNNPLLYRDDDGRQPDPTTLARDIQTQANNLIRIMGTSHAMTRGTFEAAIAEAQAGQFVGSAGQTFRHLENLRNTTTAVANASQQLAASLDTLRRLDPRAVGPLSEALRPLLTRARDFMSLSQDTQELIREIRTTGNATRLIGMPLDTGRDVARLASTQTAQYGRSLLPPGLQQASWAGQTLQRIRELPVTLAEVRDQARTIAAGASASLSAAFTAGRAYAGSAASATVRFFGAALPVLETIGTRIISLPLIVITDENGRPLGLSDNAPPMA
ncbi:SpvB/TcaC N-terminal domain-containing protein [Geodermatophilus amargosae]|uniref:SpvB/TcaC N-terminal domain-containing protein n=1 Tax=Geodermatophilus amargosae TaxID=1296565 RepID=UPI001C317C5A|nr:SpvB/TcaC N-terminal domain-containing protein [Geodermatophilus amargosae]